jgi:hypothetical protein
MAEPLGCSSAGTVSWCTRNGSGITPGTGEPVGPIVGLVCMSATFPSADHRSRIQRRLFRCWGGAVREVAVRRFADGALREVASQKR